MQQALRTTAPNGGPCRSYRPATMQLSRSKVVMFSQGTGGKPIREFREDTGEISVPGEDKKQQSQANATLYADQIAMAKKKDNLSREMKQRLRQEYYGLGGAENKAMNSNYFLWIIVVVSVLAVMSKLTGAI